MKVHASVKKVCRNCKIVRRKAFSQVAIFNAFLNDRVVVWLVLQG